MAAMFPEWKAFQLWKELHADRNFETSTINDSPDWFRKLCDWLEVVLYSVHVGNSENESEKD